MNEREACIALNLTAGIGPARTALLTQSFGSAHAVFEQKEADLASVRGISAELAHKILENGGVPLDEEMDRIERAGVRVYTIYDDDYPSSLRSISDAPLCLYVCGTLKDPAGSHSIAIVGSRRATNYGVRMTRQFAQSAVYAGWTVVSGLAFGIDETAHEEVVSIKGSTVAVLGGGLMNIQPREHIPLAQKIVETGGAVISEFPMMFYPTRHSFPMRNRIISALSTGTIVIEAGNHSGALITAATALSQGKQVFALPGNADSEMSLGCNALIKRGEAAMITTFDDVLTESTLLPGFRYPEQNDTLAEPAAEYKPSADEMFTSESDRSVLEYLARHSDALFDSIVSATGVPADQLTRKLIAMEVARRIVRTPGGTYRLFR